MNIKRFQGDTIVSFVVGVLLLAVGILMLPQITDWGLTMLNYVIAGGIIAYVLAYLLGVVRRSRGKVQLLTIIEMVIMILIAVGLVLSQFQIIQVSEACQILGLALAMRGIVGMFKAYYYQFDSKARYSLLAFVINLAILIFGVYVFAKPFINNSDLVMILCVICFILASLCIAYGIVLASKKSKKAKSTSKKKTTK